MAEAEPTERPPVPDDALLWRRVPEWHWVDDGAGGKRVSSAAFEDDPDGSPLSCTVAAESTVATAFDPVRSRAEAFALAEFGLKVAVEKGQTPRRDPTPEEPAHVLLVGKKTKAVSRALAKASGWKWPPPGRPYPDHPPDRPAPKPEFAPEPTAPPATSTSSSVVPVVAAIVGVGVLVLLLLAWWAA